jgi:Second Messenger Oligonucleotide or Dinucleotide Synthetase domain
MFNPIFETAEEFIDLLLLGTVRELDISSELHAAARSQYQAVGQFLADHSDLRATGWSVYAQGSFLLGTVVRPLGADHFDLDMVCLLDLDVDSITKAGLKELVGNAVQRYVGSSIGQLGAPQGCKECGRCWTLQYPQAFHLDVLPSVPNPRNPPTGICLTDKDLREWQKSNPIAYARWFVAQGELLRKAAGVLERKEIPPFPEYEEEKTPLQIIVQVLKRHRDIYFQEDPDDRPPSILVTTLAAHSYAGQSNPLQGVIAVATDMTHHIEQTDGRWIVKNPVAEENFADKWNDHPERALKFFRWRDALLQDLEDALIQGRSKRGMDVVAERLAKSFGDTVTKAAGSVGDSFRAASGKGSLSMAASGVLSGAAAGTQVRPHGFYGSAKS